MVVCKCKKATKLHCFVHKVPVCGECICFLEHQICVVRTYSEWVIDGEYDWPPKCCHCLAVLEERADPQTTAQTTRLGCLLLKPVFPQNEIKLQWALLASGDRKSTAKLLNKIPKYDSHVRCVIKACQETYVKSESVKIKGKNKKRAVLATLGLLDALEAKTE